MLGQEARLGGISQLYDKYEAIVLNKSLGGKETENMQNHGMHVGVQL